MSGGKNFMGRPSVRSQSVPSRWRLVSKIAGMACRSSSSGTATVSNIRNRFIIAFILILGSKQLTACRGTALAPVRQFRWRHEVKAGREGLPDDQQQEWRGTAYLSSALQNFDFEFAAVPLRIQECHSAEQSGQEKSSSRHPFLPRRSPRRRCCVSRCQVRWHRAGRC